MVSELQKKIEAKRKQKLQADSKKIRNISGFTSDEIMEHYIPKTKNISWYQTNCIGIDEIPEKAVNGHRGGTPFYTKDKKIMRSGDSTWYQLDIKPFK
ncbi:hypothetical protein [Methanolobus bombayensis]|uniref:hypothetical protein n=1 Tax=Methanolobus bombayensis TaxID=38023 RepID=UPI001AEA91E1|nr:hypothetical protein [Methanolobus bombayensis]MBP1908559.1 lactate dehydrogenase-like 2-hydroxyacid dehydrogenase [Methanolobus bombayensis]